MSTPETLPFDQILLDGPHGPEQLTLEQFLRLPLHRRISSLLGQQIRFQLNRQQVDRTLALRALMDRTRKTAA